jgi:hypothetical protein
MAAYGIFSYGTDQYGLGSGGSADSAELLSPILFHQFSIPSVDLVFLSTDILIKNVFNGTWSY